MPFKMKPILFNSAMVQALIEGNKTQTRRVVPSDWIQSSKEPLLTHGVGGIWHFWNSGEHKSKYQINDILYVRETFRPFSNVTMDSKDVGIEYKADGEFRIWRAEFEDAYYAFDEKWKPSTNLPKKFSRIFLKVTDVRLERLQDISEDDAVSEGIEELEYDSDFYHAYFPLGQKNGLRCCSSAIESFSSLWDCINKKRGHSWESNPWVFVYDFEKVNVNTLEYSVEGFGNG